MDAERCYPNLIGVFVREFPIVTGRVAGTTDSEVVKYHGSRYRIVGDPHGNRSRYAFDVYLIAEREV
jgi:hypothetical protein